MNVCRTSSSESLGSTASSGSMDFNSTMSAQANAELRILLGPKPKRPLSAYNLFFRSERQKMISTLPIRAEGKPERSHGKCGFADMAKIISKKWNEGDIDPEERLAFNSQAEQEKARYQEEMEAFRIRRTAIFGNRKKSRKGSSSNVDKNARAKKKGRSMKHSAPVKMCIVPSKAASSNASMNDYSLRTIVTAGSNMSVSAIKSTMPQEVFFPHLHVGIDVLAQKLGSENVDFLVRSFEF